MCTLSSLQRAFSPGAVGSAHQVFSYNLLDISSFSGPLGHWFVSDFSGSHGPFIGESPSSLHWIDFSSFLSNNHLMALRFQLDSGLDSSQSHLCHSDTAPAAWSDTAWPAPASTALGSPATSVDADSVVEPGSWPGSAMGGCHKSMLSIFDPHFASIGYSDGTSTGERCLHPYHHMSQLGHHYNRWDSFGYKPEISRHIFVGIRSWVVLARILRLPYFFLNYYKFNLIFEIQFIWKFLDLKDPLEMSLGNCRRLLVRILSCILSELAQKLSKCRFLGLVFCSRRVFLVILEGHLCDGPYVSGRNRPGEALEFTSKNSSALGQLSALEAFHSLRQVVNWPALSDWTSKSSLLYNPYLSCCEVDSRTSILVWPVTLWTAPAQILQETVDSVAHPLGTWSQICRSQRRHPGTAIVYLHNPRPILSLGLSLSQLSYRFSSFDWPYCLAAAETHSSRSERRPTQNWSLDLDWNSHLFELIYNIWFTDA